MNKSVCPKCNGTGAVYSAADIGKSMRALRRKAGVTMSDAALALGFSVGYVSDLELGQREWIEGRIDLYKKVVAKLGRKAKGAK